jgi:hypothetical protein
LSGGVVTRRMPYRDDEQALFAKKELLEQDRARIEEHKRTLAQLAQDEARVTRELADVEQRLAKRKKSLPLLGAIRIASPCNADWNSMIGDEQTRFCGSCAKNVYNLSAMTSQQAEALIREKEGNLCARYFQRADGTVMTADCPVGVRKKRVRAAAFVAAVGAGIGGYALTSTTGQMEASDTRMGKLEAFDGEIVQEQRYLQTMGALAVPADLLDVEMEDPPHQQVVQKVNKDKPNTKPAVPNLKMKRPVSPNY